jgi:hypothetical protein
MKMKQRNGKDKGKEEMKMVIKKMKKAGEENKDDDEEN